MLNPALRKESQRQERGDEGKSGTDLKYGPVLLEAKNKLSQDGQEKMI